ncbi:PGC-1 and ERR-induced regulator in muscle protein 1 isoform X1 [Symphalangus syndactylus]|uniref:PGC-1 and ERR-induced regulator in muscle protein 1 isoform X1 n=1 Tax=Symphalangus syndactylus TaxID=9590 RepID=UPI002441C447|nr:PGC-1 and ERR-induced regulator in muscle protein 1 isoform X1 [Symphalangus syndactylus]
MENFQYSVQLSDQDWAEFSATADECGLLQAGLASGDEPLSSDIDQGDSSGSSPPRAPPLPTGQPAAGGRSWRGCEEEDVATQQPVTRSRCEPVLALGTGQQTPSTSARAEAPPSLGPCASPPGQCSSCPAPASSADQMQRLLQGPAPRPPGEPPGSPESRGHSTGSQRPPDSPGAPPRSPSRKKRRAVGAKGGGHAGASASARMGSPRLPAASPETAKLIAKAGQEESGPGPAKAPEPGPRSPVQGDRPGPGLGLSTPVPVTEQGTDQIRTSPRAQLHTVSTPVREAHPDVSRAKSDMAVCTPASEPQPNRDMAVSTPASEPQPDRDMAVSTPASERQPDRDTAVCTPASEPQPDTAVSTPASEPQSSVAVSTPISKPQLDTDMAVSTPASEPQPDMAVSTPASKHGLDVALPTAGPVAKLEVASSPPVSEAVPRMTESSGLVSIPVPRADAAGPAWSPTRRAGPDVVETEVVVSEPSAGAPGCCSGAATLGLTQVPRKKKVRFSVAGPGPNKPGSEEASARPSAPRTATGGQGGPGAWDAVAVGPRPHQPRILKHLPRPPPSAVARAGPGSSFAVTLPEAYEFFFCDTIEEDEDAEATATGQDPAGVQWPDMCEFFFPDGGAQRSRQWGSPAPLPRADPVPTPIPGDPVPISIPEVYEHFFGEDRLEGVLVPAVPLPLQALEPPGSASQGAGPGTPLKPAVVERLHLALRRAGELRGPVPSFAFSQNDMCLVFVAFATWAVRTSDLHTPDAWKTVLLANIGTISAIRYFRRQVGQGRRSRSRSPSS